MIGFTTPCFILENNSDIRNKLINLGYKLCECYKISFEPKVTCCTPDGIFHLTNDSNIITDILGDLGIDCGTNEEFFLAIAALRDDSDIHQWFTDCYRWELCGVNKASYEGWKNRYKSVAHKATVEELIKRFAQ